MSIKETAKGEAKEIAKSKIKKTIIRYCMPFIAIVLIACIFFAFIFGTANIIKDKLNDLKNKIVSWTSSLWYKDGIHIKNADVVDFIKTLETEGISISDLGMAADNVTVNNDETASEEDEDIDDKVTDEEKKSIKYIKKFMEASIASETIDTNHNGHGIAGCIKLKRDNARTGIVTDDIKYVDMDKIQDYENADYEKYYSLDDSGNLVIIVQNQNDEMATYSTKTINYKSAVSQYTMPIMFFVDICMTTQNPEYVKALAQEVIDNTKIEITLEESSSIITTTTTTETHPADGDAGSSSATSTSIITQVTPVITTVDELLYKLQQTYTKTVNTNTSSQLGRAIHEDEGWSKTDSTTTTTIYTFQAGTELEPEIKYQKDDPFPKISKTEYYVPYYHGNIEAYSSLISGGDMLFEMMDSNMDNDTLEQVLKYVLYKMSKVSFGVTELDPNLLKINEFYDVSGGFYGGDASEKVWFALKDAGYSEYAISGVLGNMYVESTVTTTAVNSSSGAYGLCQWLGGRKDQLFSYAQSQGKDTTDADVQINYLLAELTPGGKGIATYQCMSKKFEDAWKQATNCSAATDNFYELFERGGPDQKALTTRTHWAQYYYDLYNGKEKPSGGGGTFTAGSGNIVGHFTSDITKKTFTIWQQSSSFLPGQCNRAAAASIASGYTSENNAIQKVISAGPNIGSDFKNSVAYFGQFDLKYTSVTSVAAGYPSRYMATVRGTLNSGAYIMIWLNPNGRNYYGTSGTCWTTLYHWVSIIGYRKDTNGDGNDEIYVSDSGGGHSNWYSINEFQQSKVEYVDIIRP